MADPLISILMLEDSPLDAELIAAHLAGGGLRCEIDRVVDRTGFRAALDRRAHDIILADYELPSFGGGEALAMACADASDTPFIFVSGVLGEENAVESLKRGATDYVVKQRLGKLPSSVRRALTEARERTERAQMEAELALSYAALRRSEERLQRLNETLELRVAERTMELATANAKLRDEVAERERAEAALRQAQKMEAVGQLTGGVAHDFNNLLTVVIGGLETVERRAATLPALPEASAITAAAGIAMQGARRAATLTHSLLAFSRKQTLQPRPTETNRLVADLSDLLHLTLSDSITLEPILADDLWQTMVDPNQLEAALLNLAVNARDAMPDGGRLTVETANAWLDENAADLEAENVEPGQYVVIAVTDTGFGMSADTLAHAYEPFFTTKGVGHGTGLGLSQVYGFVKQSNGHIRIWSEQGRGTMVRLYLPRLIASAPEAPPVASTPIAAGGAETILVVEDNDIVREYSAGILRELGYQVLEAADGAWALRVLGREPGVRLLFTDIGLPGGMDGGTLAERALAEHPELKVLFTTGYAGSSDFGRDGTGGELIRKPFSYADMAAKIRSALGSAVSG